MLKFMLKSACETNTSASCIFKTINGVVIMNEVYVFKNYSIFNLSLLALSSLAPTARLIIMKPCLQCCYSEGYSSIYSEDH